MVVWPSGFDFRLAHHPSPLFVGAARGLLNSQDIFSGVKPLTQLVTGEVPKSCFFAHPVTPCGLYFCCSLKVRDAETYGWAPRRLLAQLTGIYVNLDAADGEGNENNRFAASIAEDERSYSPDLFAAAQELMSRHGIQTLDNITQFGALGEKVRGFAVFSLLHLAGCLLRECLRSWWSFCHRAVMVAFFVLRRLALLF